MKSSVPLQSAIVGCVWAEKEYTYGTLDDGCRLVAEFSRSVPAPLPVVSFVHDDAACQLDWSDPDSLKAMYRDFISRFRPGPDLSFDPPYRAYARSVKWRLLAASIPGKGRQDLLRRAFEVIAALSGPPVAPEPPKRGRPSLRVVGGRA
jgi:hypothetical protein